MDSFEHICVQYWLSSYLVWCPKYRRKVLVGGVEIRLKELLYEKADEIDVQIAKLDIMPDHIHAFVKTRPINAPHYIVRQLKGYTARVLRLELPHLLKMPSLRTRSYYCESVVNLL
jgi:putative transposase